MKKLLVIIMSLSTFHAYHPIELAQPFVEVGVIVRENLIGPRTIKAQINSVIKGGILGAINHICCAVDSTLVEKKILEKNYWPFFNISNSISFIDLIQNHKDTSIMSKVLGFYVGKVFISNCLNKFLK